MIERPTPQRVLIANRGEIAVRVARACRDTGRTSIAVYADEDVDSMHVRVADEAYALSTADGYLDGAVVIEVARRAGADAIHPGYGFLSENADFAAAVIKAGLVWVGPPAEVIRVLGDKVTARQLALEVGAPLAAGSDGALVDAGEAVAFAREAGLPIMIKAAHGGGGRGIRIVRRLEDVAELYAAAVREAIAAFGEGACFAERYLVRPRHVEVQILADAHGGVAAIGTRDCSVQRRHQKLVEEAPAPDLPEPLRRRLLTSAEDICRAAGYVGAGTVEYLLAEDGTLAFLEVNTRLQVEHPVTEEVTGLDLVGWQLAIAAGAELGPTVWAAREAALSGAERRHAIELRLTAEDPGRGFLPSPGKVARWDLPAGPGVRVDAGYQAGDAVPEAFDSLLAKIIVSGPDRAIAVARARRALAEVEVVGVATVAPFLAAVLEAAEFADDFDVHTAWVEEEFTERFEGQPATDPAEADPVERTWLEIEGRRVRVGIPAGLVGSLGRRTDHDSGARNHDQSGPGKQADEGAVRAPVSGTLGVWGEVDGATVAEGQRVGTIEAMKMETPIIAQVDGTLRLMAEPGSSVKRGDEVARID
ncbi:acetyl/propionyl/methylcrotonyl-CoA carboxylase subunit alpha [Parenemella sanctibonifatiensis]|uniref:biotin carboxylase n=1 Tax=Parenemella sanctibonifatiensis TaxID=2016505 RepID=A0A255EDQ2_9ACTN|nr:acetyl/propionyl-CoA carboxylase subunit alpha [Parenemella sanctibonifatiensis]